MITYLPVMIMFGFFTVFFIVILLVVYRKRAARAAVNHQEVEAQPSHDPHSHAPNECTEEQIIPLSHEAHHQHMAVAVALQKYYGEHSQFAYVVPEIYKSYPPFGDPKATYDQPTHSEPAPAYGQPAPTHSQLPAIGQPVTS